MPPNLAQLTHCGHRALRVVYGNADACRSAAHALMRPFSAVRWVGEAAPDRVERVALTGTRRWLGSECDALVFDAHCGFDPNVFGAAAGTVRAGGLLVLLSPPLPQWPRADDPVNQRVCVHGHTIAHSRYLLRIANRLAVLQCSLDDATAVTPVPAVTPSGEPWSPPRGPTRAQAAIVDTLSCDLQQQNAFAAVIQADRGRGKSATLGWLAARLAERGVDVAVTAPSRRTADVLYRHALASWPAEVDESRLSFIAPDAIPDMAERVLLVDEAASLHLGLTAQILQRCRKVVFAGTVHGYEGAGRGFATRFDKLLAHAPHRHRAITLDEPIRWAAGDPLEACVNDLLMLDATTDSVAEATPCAWVDRDALVAQEVPLRALYALLAQSHYRTRPLDLRHLLDGPNLRVAVLGPMAQPTATALIAEEGEFADDTLRDAIAAGTRRPRGHLLPQLLAWQHRERDALALRWWRVVRIAVHPQRQRRGYGAQVLDWLAAQAAQAGVDALGSSFGGDPGTCRFWSRTGYAPVYLGHVREATSGQFSVAVMRPLSPRARTVFANAKQHFVGALGARSDIDAHLAQQLRQADSA